MMAANRDEVLCVCARGCASWVARAGVSACRRVHASMHLYHYGMVYRLEEIEGKAKP